MTTTTTTTEDTMSKTTDEATVEYDRRSKAWALTVGGMVAAHAKTKQGALDAAREYGLAVAA